MDLWIKLLEVLISKGYLPSDKTKYLKHIEFPKIHIGGFINEDINPFITTYELIELIEILGGINKIEKGTCIINTSDISHVEWIEYIGTIKAPSNIDIEVNITTPNKDDSNEEILNVVIHKGLLECDIRIKSDRSYEGYIQVSKDINNIYSQALIIWECEFDNVLNTNISKILHKYFRVVRTIGICNEDFEFLDLDMISVVIKISLMNYMSRTIHIKRHSIYESRYEEILTEELDKYLLDVYHETPKV